MWDWHRDSNWVAGKEGDDATNYRNVARAQAYDRAAKENWAKGNRVQAQLNEADALRTRGKSEIAAQGLEKAAFGHFTRDGVFSSNGTSMAVAARSITPIQDGSVKLATTDPKDVGLFAKTGGPFDKLFNDIFGRIDAVYNTIGGNTTNTNLGDTLTRYSSIASTIGGNTTNTQVEPLPMKDTSTIIKEQWGNALHDTGTNMTSPSTFDKPIDVNVHGDITLKSENGQSFDISRELENDPFLIRTISQLITRQISNAINGGRGTLPIAIGNV